MGGHEDRITALLQLRGRIEQELRADTIRMEDLKHACDEKVRWLRYLDEIISDDSFQPASELLGKLPAGPGEVLGDRASVSRPAPPAEPRKDTSQPVNIKHPRTNALLASIHFLEGTVSIAFSDKVNIAPESPTFQQAIHASILLPFEKAGGRIFLERDEETGYLRSITILGHFPSSQKDRVAGDLERALAPVVK